MRSPLLSALWLLASTEGSFAIQGRDFKTSTIATLYPTPTYSSEYTLNKVRGGHDLLKRATCAAKCPAGWACPSTGGPWTCNTLGTGTNNLICSTSDYRLCCAPDDTATNASLCPADNKCISSWGPKQQCQKPNTVLCPTAGTQCSLDKWCCGSSCGGTGDSCCWNSQTSKEYLCAAGSKCGNNACAPIPTQSPQIDAWTAQGCYSDSTGSRGLPNSYVGNDVKLGVCATKAAGFKYFAVEYGVECYWGNSLAQSSVKSDASKCDTGCAGFPAAQCGGAGFMNLYQNGQYVPPTTTTSRTTTTVRTTSRTTTAAPTPTILQNVGAYTNIGCFSDPVTPRILNDGTFVDYNALTVQQCIAKAGSGFKYAAVEYYGECYWGNELASRNPATCDTTCAGNVLQNCGGAGAAQVYENTAYQPPQSSTTVRAVTSTSTSSQSTTSVRPATTSSQPAAGATVLPAVGTFRSKGCYQDSSSNRILIAGGWGDNNGLTVAACAAKAGNSFKYFAVEYAVECYWGNELIYEQASNQCNMPCNGDKTQLCGGTNAANVYENTAYGSTTTSSTTSTSVPTTTAPAASPITLSSSGDWNSKGCYRDQDSPRLLTKGAFGDGALTVEKCISQAGYVRYIGVEFGGECYYGNVLSTTASASNCDVVCSGNTAYLCGGAYAANVYENSAWRPPLSRDEIIQAITDINQRLITLNNAVQAWRIAMQNSNNKVKLRRRQSSPQDLLNTVKDLAQALGKIFAQRAPQVQEAYELQTIGSEVLDVFIAQEARYRAAYANVATWTAIGAGSIAIANEVIQIAQSIWDILKGLIDFLTPKDPTNPQEPSQTQKPTTTTSATSTTTSSSSTTNSCGFWKSVATQSPEILKRDPLVDISEQAASLRKRYSNTQIGSYGTSFMNAPQPDVQFCGGNDVFHFFAHKYPSTAREAGVPDPVDNGANDDAEAEDIALADLEPANSAPGLPGIGVLNDAGRPFINEQWEYMPNNQGICNPRLSSFPGRIGSQNDPEWIALGLQVTQWSYDTEHVFERHMVKDFFYYVFQQGIADCRTLKRVFGDEPIGEDAAKKMMGLLAWYDPAHPEYPGSSLNELFVLRRDLNLFKGAIMNGRPLTENEPLNRVLPREPSNDFYKISKVLLNGRLTMEYLNNPNVARAFVNAKSRIRNFLADPNLFAAAYTPAVEAGPNGPEKYWEDIWDEWMRAWLTKRQQDVNSWRQELLNKMANSPNMDPSWQGGPAAFAQQEAIWFPAFMYQFPLTWYG